MEPSELRNALVDLHSASFAWAIVCCRNRELAEEVLQSVYVKVLDGRSTFEGRSQFRTWLFAVIRNAAGDHQRKRWWSSMLRLDFESLANLAGSAEEATRLEEDEELTIVRAALGKLPARQREVAHLVFYQDLSVAEAASVLGVSVGTARQHYARAKESLRLSLQTLWDRVDDSIAR